MGILQLSMGKDVKFRDVVRKIEIPNRRVRRKSWHWKNKKRIKKTKRVLTLSNAIEVESISFNNVKSIGDFGNSFIIWKEG